MKVDNYNDTQHNAIHMYVRTYVCTVQTDNTTHQQHTYRYKLTDNFYRHTNTQHRQTNRQHYSQTDSRYSMTNVEQVVSLSGRGIRFGCLQYLSDYVPARTELVVLHVERAANVGDHHPDVVVDGLAGFQVQLTLQHVRENRNGNGNEDYIYTYIYMLQVPHM